MATQTVVCESQLPVIDFSSENMKPGTDTWHAACRVVRGAFEDCGCFLARFDKVAPELVDSVFGATEELFGLPLETKRRKTSDKPNHGYTGQVSSSPLFESFAVDNPSSIEDCQKFAHIMWPPAGNYRFWYYSIFPIYMCVSFIYAHHIILENNELIQGMWLISWQHRLNLWVEKSRFDLHKTHSCEGSGEQL